MSEQETMKTWALEWYQTRIDGKRAKNTQDGYRNLIEHHIIPQLGSIQLSQLTTRRVCSFYAWLGRQGLAHNSVWCVHLLLRRILDEACREGRMDRNPVSKINFTQGEIERKTWVSTAQLNLYLEAVQLRGAYPIFYIGLASGLRQGELISLTWAAFDIQKKLLLLPKRWVQLNERATQILLQERRRYFNNRIAAEIRLPEAIDRKLLCPFQYFGVTDTVDLNTLKWSAGGYDKNELSNLYTLSGAVANRRADLVVSSLLKYVTDIDEVKGLGFCVSIEHAEFMCRYFNDHGIPSIFLTGKSSDEERKTAKGKLVSGEVRFIFVVDIYNEGVDIPEVNTVLFLRPTESLTIFLQQLGRGLRLAEGKECLTVLDFIGQANKRYNFEDKFTALLSNTTHSVTREIKDGFVSAPKGCYIQLEKKAAKYILDNIRASYGNTAGLVSRVASFTEDSGLELTLANFLDYYHLDPRAIYKFSSFSRICARADVIADFNEPLEDVLTKAFGRFAVVDSRRWIRFLLDLLPHLDDVDFATLGELEQRMLQMFYVTVWGKAAESLASDEVVDNLCALSDSPVLLGELLDLLRYRYEQIDFIDEPVDLDFDCPLDLHCTYTRDQLLVAMDFLKPATVREGVKWLPEKQLDVFFVTLNKADKDYSPTTMYHDYSINENLFHWQSQSTTAVDSPTGQRYIHHRERGSKVLLFVREFKADRITGSAAAYTFLGTANYVKHDGSRPMNITWQLDRPIPAKFLKKTNKLVVG